jgi:predicted TIM-barrel fold metal-dependent hydrolase
MAQSLNYWAANVRDIFSPATVALGTFHPDDGDAIPDLVEEAFGRLNLSGAALHPRSGAFALDDPRLSPLYDRLAQTGKVLVVHAGRRPEPSEFTGATAFRRFMRRNPSLTVVVGSMGADEFDAFFDLCELYDGLHLDTAFVFNHYLGGPPPLERLLEFQDRVLYGSAYPNIPYRVESAIRGIRDLRLGRAIEEKLFCTNTTRVFGLDLMPF